jgi:hypothetical protein
MTVIAQSFVVNSVGGEERRREEKESLNFPFFLCVCFATAISLSLSLLMSSITAIVTFHICKNTQSARKRNTRETVEIFF